MNDLWMKTILAGLFLGAWPLLMNKSKLTGNVSAAVFCLVALTVVLPFALKNIDGSLATANWTMAISAGFVAGLGLLAFNSMLARATPENISTFFVVNLLVQVSVSAVYQMVVTRSLTLSRGVGFVAAAVAACLLTRTR